MINKGHPKYNKRYMTTLSGRIRKEYELYKVQNQMKDAEAIRELVRLGLEKRANPHFKSRFSE